MSDQNKHKLNGEASQQQNDKILNILGFGKGEASETSQQLPEEREAFEKHKHALKIIVYNGTVKDFLGKRLTYKDLDSLSLKQLKKYYELYTEKKNSMIASSLIDAFIDGFTLLVSKTISIDDVESYRSDLKNDFLTSNGINHVVGMIASFIGQPLGLCSASIITAKLMTCGTYSKSEGPDCVRSDGSERQQEVLEKGV